MTNYRWLMLPFIVLTVVVVGSISQAAVSVVSWTPQEMTLRSTAQTAQAAKSEALTWLIGTEILHQDIYQFWQAEIAQKILTNVDQYILACKPTNDSFHLQVDLLQVVRGLVGVVFGEVTPRVAVSTWEMIIRAPAPDPALDIEMNRAFVEYGLTVVDLNQAACADIREALLQDASGESWAKVDLNSTINADILVVGVGVAEEMTNRTGFQARAEFKAIEVATGRVLGAFADPHQTVQGPTAIVVAKEALQRASSVSAPRLIASMLNAYGKPIIQIRLNKVRSFNEVNRVRSELQQRIPGSTVSIMTCDVRGTAMAVLQISAKTDALRVAMAMDELAIPVRVVDVAMRYITADLQ